MSLYCCYECYRHLKNKNLEGANVWIELCKYCYIHQNFFFINFKDAMEVEFLEREGFILTIDAHNDPHYLVYQIKGTTEEYDRLYICPLQHRR